MTRPKSNLLIFLLILAFAGQKCLAQTYATGLSFDDTAYMQAPKKAALTRGLDSVPSRASIKEFAPTPKHQGGFNTCTAWACAYCARTMVDAIRNNWTDKDSITAHAYSPAFLFRLLSPADNGCAIPTNIDHAFQLMKTKGDLRYTDLPVPCSPFIDTSQFGKASLGRLKDYARLFDVSSSNNFKIQAVKKSISEKKPVVIGMICPPSFVHAYNCWQPTEQPSLTYGGHAMCVVSYDDTLYNGGAFEIQNSWGENWGNGGYVWIRYSDFAMFVRYGYELIDIPEVSINAADLSGSIKLELLSNVEMPANLLVSTRGLTVEAAQKTAEPLTIYKTANAYGSGTRFRILISNDQPAYVYAISSDLSNADNVLFPLGNVSAALTYKKNAFAIPDEDSDIKFDGKPGTDFLCVLYSKSELDINALIKKIHAEQGTFNERVFKAVGDRIVDPSDVKFANDKIAFKASSKGKDILAMVVEMDHK